MNELWGHALSGLVGGLAALWLRWALYRDKK